MHYILPRRNLSSDLQTIVSHSTAIQSLLMKFNWQKKSNGYLKTIKRLSTSQPSLHKKWSFPLRISSVNMTKSAVYCEYGHIYWRNPKWKASFFVQDSKQNAVSPTGKLKITIFRRNCRLSKRTEVLDTSWNTQVCSGESHLTIRSNTQLH